MLFSSLVWGFFFCILREAVELRRGLIEYLFWKIPNDMAMDDRGAVSSAGPDEVRSKLNELFHRSSLRFSILYMPTIRS